jgi:DNA-directed RNA polymerase specialized sigma24 family protein
MNGLGVFEIAEALGEAPNTVSVRLRRALDRLREKMNPET